MKNNDKGTTQYTRLEESTVITGDIKTESDIRIDGKLEGVIETSRKLIIGKGGSVNGKVVCQNADIEGKLVGEITVKDTLSLKASGEIEGEISLGKLVVEAGAVFNATCKMGNGAMNASKRKSPKAKFAELYETA